MYKRIGPADSKTFMYKTNVISSLITKTFCCLCKTITFNRMLEPYMREIKEKTLFHRIYNEFASLFTLFDQNPRIEGE